MAECYEEEYTEKKDISPEKKALQEECANCERWDIIHEHACATRCVIFQALSKEE